MRRLPLRFCIVSVVALALNAAGIVWIRHEVASGERSPKSQPPRCGVGWPAPTRPPEVPEEPATPAPDVAVRVLRALPAHNVDGADRFALDFDQFLVESADLRQPLSSPPFVIRPRPRGHWEWARLDRLEFVLDEPLPAGRVFRITPAADLGLPTGRRLEGRREFTFKTRPLRVTSCRLESFDRSHVSFELRFNQPVHPADAVTQVRVTGAGQTPLARPVPLTAVPSERLVMRTERAGTHRLTVELDAALTGHGAELSLGRRYTRTLTIAPAFTLLDADVSTPSLGREVSVNIRLSSGLDRQQKLPRVEITPHVEGVRVTRGYRSLVLEGPFESGRRYTARVCRALLSSDGQTLDRDETVRFTVPDRTPSLRFRQPCGFLMPDGNLALELETVNVPGVRFNTWRVHANNLVAHVRGAHTSATGRRLAEDTFEVDLPHNKPGSVAISLRGLLGKPLDSPLGVYRLEARATDKHWRQASALVTVTDLGITSKRERGGFMVWVTSLRSGKPLEGVRVGALTYNNQELASAETGADGTATLAIPTNHPDGRAWLLVAQRGEDMSYLKADARCWVIDDFDQSGRDIPRTYDVMLYTERGVYRPGETVRLTGVVRDALGRVPPTFPLSVKVTRPDGRRAAEITASPEDVQGVFQVEFHTRDDFQTGPYRFQATLPGSDEVLGGTKTLVETFVPVRLHVTAEPKAPRFGPGEGPELNVSGRYLFGRPASGLPVSVAGEYALVAFESGRYKGFSFRPADTGVRHGLGPLEAELDAQGEAKVALDSTRPGAPGLWRAQLAATVTETGGRSVSANTSMLVDTAWRHVGLRIDADRLVHVGRPVKLEWVVLTGEDEQAPPGGVAISLDRVDHDRLWQEVNGRYVWKHQENPVRVLEKTFDADEISAGLSSMQLTCHMPGRYRLKALDVVTGNVTQIEFHAADPARGPASVATERPERLEIVPDRKSYAPGSKAKVLVRSPFPGTMLLTVETDRVIDGRVMELSGNEVEVELDVDPALRGGAFVTGTVVRAMDPREKSWEPHRAMGLARLVTDHWAKRLDVSVDAPEEARPGDSLSVRVEARSVGASGRPDDADALPSADRPGIVHVWAVDEGVLITTGFFTPDPHQHFLAQRRAGVTTSDVFDDLLPDFARPEAIDRIGAGGAAKTGDYASSVAARRNPVPCDRREAAVVWRAASPLGPDGTADFTLEMPEITGEMRIMAVVVDGDRYASRDRKVRLTAPLLVEASWPRFAAPGDSFSVPVKLFNNSGAPLSASLEFDVRGPVLLKDEHVRDGIPVDPREPTLLWVEASAVNIGPVYVRVRAQALSDAGEPLSAKNAAEFPVRPTAPLHTEARFFRAVAGRALEIAPPQGFYPGSASTKLTIGAEPLVEVRPAVERLIAYPYGCIEQTSSRLYAMLYAPHLLALDDAAGAQAEPAGWEGRSLNAANLVEAGIDRLWSMQTPSGGLGYWPGATKPHLWGTGYASFLLLKAKQAGYEVDDRFIDALSDFLEATLALGGERGPEDNTRALFCHVLAGFGRPQHGWMARLSEISEKLDIAGRANLAAAWFHSGRKDRAGAVLSNGTLDLPVTGSTGGRITSRLRQQALLLLILLEIDPGHSWIPKLVKKIHDQRRNGYWGSTLENATALAALARYQTLVPFEADYAGTVSAPGGGEYTFDHRRPTVFQFKETGEPVAIASRGMGVVLVSAFTEGLSVKGAHDEYDRWLKARRRWTDLKGRELDGRTLAVGDLVNVETTICCPGLPRHKQIHNVAIVDALSGGMEVENPRLATSASPGAGGWCSPDHVEFLDDRVVVFTSAGREPRTFRYALRVIAEGDFALPPVQASCMYDADYASVHGAGRVEAGRFTPGQSPEAEIASVEGTGAETRDLPLAPALLGAEASGEAE
jgi:uncharacterized protein YfaS (alpha-2-macroglobulin family)